MKSPCLALAFAALCVAFDATATCPAGVSTQNEIAATFVTTDIAHFWYAVDHADDDLATALAREYFDKGSPGLENFRRLRIRDAQTLAGTIRRAPKYYAALRQSTRRIDEFIPQMRAAFACLKAIYPEATFPPVYFLVGRLNSGGTLDRDGLYIGVDMFGKTGESAMAELNAWQRAVVGPVERLPFIVSHEIIHAQQDDARDNTLLARALREGIPDFIGNLIAGGHINPHLHAFGDVRERELWRAFEKDMSGDEVGNWLYQGDKAKPDWPADLGYYVGYKIAQAYYQRAPDKRTAIRDMLRIRDFPAFLRASGYADDMNSLVNL